MKKILFAIAILAVVSSYAQQSTFTYQPCFSAVVVKDIKKSLTWYQSVFDFKVKNEIKDETQGYAVAILESSGFILELLELRESLDQASLLRDKPAQTKVQGHFKIGFRVSDIDACLRRLKELGVEVPNVYTDRDTGRKNFLIRDPDGNLIQFFE